MHESSSTICFYRVNWPQKVVGNLSSISTFPHFASFSSCCTSHICPRVNFEVKNNFLLNFFVLQNDWSLHQCWQLWKKKSRIDVFETRINKHCFLILSKFCFSNVKASTKENKCCAIFFFAKLEELYWKPISCCQVLMMQFDEKALSTWVFSRHATLLYSVQGLAGNFSVFPFCVSS